MTATRDFCAGCGWVRPVEDVVAGRDKFNRPILRKKCAECIKAKEDFTTAVKKAFGGDDWLDTTESIKPAWDAAARQEPKFTAAYVWRARRRAFWYGVLVGILLSVSAVTLSLIPR